MDANKRKESRMKNVYESLELNDLRKHLKSLAKDKFKNKTVSIRIDGTTTSIFKEIKAITYSGVLGTCIEIDGSDLIE
jgi:hypothetical protein